MTKTVVITGATGTLGQAIAARFDPDPIGEWDTSLWDIYGFGSEVDVACERDVYWWMRNRISSNVEPLDALVTCAGVSLVKSSLEMSISDWRNVIKVNLDGTFLAAREAIKAGATRIVTIGSIHGCTPTSYPFRAAYTASKAGVMGLTQALAVEFAPQGVAVNCVAPGHLPVLMDDSGAGQTLLDAARKRTPTGKLTTPQDVADVVYWLCNDAPLNLTGQIIVLDGGFSMNSYPLK